jgi:signal transduction histidine kinase
LVRAARNGGETGVKILIIDDQADIRATLQDLLEINGYEVLAAEDGVQGVKLAAQKPDFIFCDMAMPNLDGAGVLAAIKQLPDVCDVPFVFLTARAERRDQREGMALGADDYISKPFTEREILDAIAARTKRQRNVREKIEQLAEQHRREVHAHWSHELLTPLNAVMGSLDLIELDADNISRAELKEMLALIRHGAERQERLARKLIRYFSLEQALLAPQPAKTGRCQAHTAIGAGARQAAREKNREHDLVLSTEPGEVAVDDEWLKNGIYEVVSNAVNFSTAGTPITVSGTRRDGRYRIEVADQGPGLTPEQRAGVGAFTQFDRKKREQQGLGLGLAIARATARIAGGHLLLEAGPAERGLKVIFDLPLAT